MSTFVFVHGANQGAWCWYKVVPQLESLGERVLTVDLPGHGVDRTPLTELTIHDYADHVESVLNTTDEPVVLVGHSMGALVAKEVAERHPEQIAAIVFIAGAVLGEEQTMLTHPLLAPNLANAGPYMVIDERTATALLTPEGATRYYYSGCDPADIALALRVMTPEPTSVMATSVTSTAARYGSVLRFGIVTLQDELILPDTQYELYKQDGINEISTISTGHSPFLADPDTLAKQLLHFANVAA